MNTPRSLARRLLTCGLAALAGTALAAEPVAQDSNSTNGVEFIVTPYLWNATLDGRIGIRGREADLEVKMIDYLRLAGMLTLEARKDRWGLLLDGLYVELFEEATPPSAFFESVDVTYEQASLDVGVFYRILEGDRGWVDLIGGARYMYYAAEVEFDPDYAEAESISAEIMGVITEKLGAVVEPAVARKVDDITGEVNEILAKRTILEKTGAIEGGSDQINDAVQAAIQRAAQDTFNDLKELAPEAVEKAAGKAEKSLTETIRGSMEQIASTKVSGDTDWVDSYIGLRARWVATDHIYLGVRGDVGGFGIGSASDLVWQFFGGVGYAFTPSVAMELGWRYIDMDYDSGGFMMDATYSGGTIGVAVKL